MKFANYVMLIITVGVMILLFTIIIGDYIIAFETNRLINPEIITLLKMSVTGLIGIIGGYLGGKQSSKDE
jgi:tellurite resistance protein TehA-like permease